MRAMFVLMAIRTAKAIAVGSTATVSLLALAFAQSPPVQGVAPAATLKNLGGMAQGLARFGVPGGPPVIYLDSIDGKEPKDFGQKGKNCVSPMRGAPKKCSFGSKFTVALAPGQHSLSVGFTQAGYNNTFLTSKPVDVSFAAESGHTYLVECTVDNSSGRWIPFVVELNEKGQQQIVLPSKQASSCSTAEDCRTKGARSMAAGALPDALADFAKAIELKPDDAVAYAGRADARFHLGDYDSSIADYTKAIELNPASAQHYYVSRAIVKLYEPDLDGAIADYTKAIELKPNDWLTYQFRGDANWQKCDVDRAIADYTKSIEILPSFSTAYEGRSRAKQAEGDMDGAIADCAEATRLSRGTAACQAGLKQRGEPISCKQSQRRIPPPPVPPPPPLQRPGR